MQNCHCLSKCLNFHTGLHPLNHGPSQPWVILLSQSYCHLSIVLSGASWWTTWHEEHLFTVLSVCLHSAYTYESEESHPLSPFHCLGTLIPLCCFMLSMNIMSWTIADTVEFGWSVYKKCPPGWVWYEDPDSPQCSIFLNFLWLIELHYGIGLIDGWCSICIWPRRQYIPDPSSIHLPYYLLHGKDASANQPLHPWSTDWVWSTGQLMFYVIPDLPEVSQCIDQTCLYSHSLVLQLIAGSGHDASYCCVNMSGMYFGMTVW